MESRSIQTADGFLFVYSITSKPSFERINEYITYVDTILDGVQKPSILVGNKCDLEICREVTKSEGSELATRLGFYFEESSAKLRIRSDEVFQTILRHLISKMDNNNYNSHGESKKRCIIL